MEEIKDSFTIGSAASGVSIKIYFDILEPDTPSRIDKAIQLYKNSLALSGRAK